MYDQTESIPDITFDLLGTTWIFDLLGKAHASRLFFYGFHGFTSIMSTERQKIDEQYVTQVKKLPKSRVINPRKSDTMYKLKLKLVTQVKWFNLTIVLTAHLLHVLVHF